MTNTRKIEFGNTREYDASSFRDGQKVIIYLKGMEGTEYRVRQGTVHNRFAIRAIEGEPQASARDKACLELILDWRGTIPKIPYSLEHESPRITEDLSGKKVKSGAHRYASIYWAEEVTG